MYSASPQIVEVAHEGLRRVLAVQSKLPKDLLQQGLRPILVNLADARRLSVSGLEGLARFLELLTNYFKVEIGVKLLDHFKSLAEPAMLQNAAARPYEDNQDIARMVRLVNIFRLLPPTANTFLRDLTEQVSEAEAKLMQSRPGPFSENLALYFDKYPEDATNFLLERLDKVQLVRTYRHTLASGKAPKFVTELSDQADKLCELCFRDQDKLHLVLPGIQIIDELSATSDDWLSKHVNVLQALVSVWRSLVVRSKGPREESYSRVFSQEPTLILKIFIRYLEQHQDIELLFHVVEAFEIQSAVDRSDVTDFLYRRVAASDNLQFKRDIFTHFLDLYANQNVSSAFKKNALRYIINPLLWLNYSRRDPSLSTDNIIVKGVPSRITAAIWHPLIAARHGGEDSLHIELLHMSAILVHYCPDVVGEVRKDIIMVAWESIRRAGDATVKHMAYLLAGRFFHAYESPSNIVRPTWHGLLRVKETEGRTLYRQAINVVARCLPKRDPPKPDQISWAAATKKVLTEEGNATPQLVSVCELLVGNPDLFYNSRDLFVSLMANSLTKLGFVPAATADMKKLTIDIVELIFRWERRRLTGAAFTAIEAESTLEDSKKRPSPGETPAAKRQKIEGAGSSPAPAIPGSGWQLPVHVRELITSYIVRLVSTSPESISRGGLTHRAVQLLREIIGPDGLPGVTVKLSFFQRTMAQVSGMNVTQGIGKALTFPLFRTLLRPITSRYPIPLK
jgi:transformation/transcription domain-associated protein